MKNRNWFWGIFLILSAVFVISSQTGWFGQIGLFSIIATVLLVALLIQSIIYRNFFGVFFPLAFLYMIYWKPLGLVSISPWLLLLAAVLISMGFSFIFNVRPPKVECSGGFEQYHQTIEDIDDNNPYAKVSLGASSKYLHSDCLKSGRFYVSLGALELYFDQVQLSPEGAEIFIDCSLGAVKLYIPKSWHVNDKLRTSLGGVEDDRHFAQPEPGAPQLTITGNVSMGGVEIHYI